MALSKRDVANINEGFPLSFWGKMVRMQGASNAQVSVSTGLPLWAKPLVWPNRAGRDKE